MVGGRDYYSHLPGHKRALRLAGAGPEPRRVAPDPAYLALQRLREAQVMPGTPNVADVAAGFARLDFAPATRLDVEVAPTHAAAQAGRDHPGMVGEGRRSHRRLE